MPVGVKAARAALMGGDRIMVTHVQHEGIPSGAVYALIRSGTGLRAGVYDKLSDHLRPVEDGLFPGASQTFEWSEP